MTSSNEDFGSDMSFDEGIRVGLLDVEFDTATEEYNIDVREFRDFKGEEIWSWDIPPWLAAGTVASQGLDEVSKYLQAERVDSETTVFRYDIPSMDEREDHWPDNLDTEISMQAGLAGIKDPVYLAASRNSLGENEMVEAGRKVIGDMVMYEDEFVNGLPKVNSDYLFL